MDCDESRLNYIKTENIEALITDILSYLQIFQYNFAIITPLQSRDTCTHSPFYKTYELKSTK